MCKRLKLRGLRGLFVACVDAAATAAATATEAAFPRALSCAKCGRTPQTQAHVSRMLATIGSCGITVGHRQQAAAGKQAQQSKQ